MSHAFDLTVIGAGLGSEFFQNRSWLRSSFQNFKCEKSQK